MTKQIERTIAFLRRKLGESPYFARHPAEGDYRLEHTFRVARIGREIAAREGLDQENMVLACLLHDVSYCGEFFTHGQWLDHGRAAAQIARPFLLEELDLPEAAAEEICFGISIHVDGRADFPGERTVFARTVGDADNIDRFGAYRLYETLEHAGFSAMPLEKKREYVQRTLAQLEGYGAADFATDTAAALWRDRIGFYADFYRRLREQLDASGMAAAPGDAPDPAGVREDAPDSRLGLAGRF